MTGNTLSVQLMSSDIVGQWVMADAVRVDRIDKNGVFTRIVDDSPAGSDPNFRLHPTLMNNQTTSASRFGNDLISIQSSTTTEQVAATWIVTGLEPGNYRVSATFQSLGMTDPSTNYRIIDGLPGAPTVLPVTENQNQTAADFDFASFKTEYEYDTAGNVVAAVTEGLPTTRRTYDSFGNVVTEQDATGVTKYNEYDALGRLVKTSVIDGKAFNFNAAIHRFHGALSTPTNTTNTWDPANFTPIPLNNGQSMYLAGNSRKAVDLDFPVTSNTILEFDFKSDEIGYFQGIGISNSLYSYLNKGFRITGDSTTDFPPEWTTDFVGYQTVGQWQHYRIPIGKYLDAGTYEYLVFVNVAFSQGKSTFSNVRVYDAAPSAQESQIVNFTSGPDTNVQSYNGVGGFDASPSSWQVLDNGSTLYLYDGARKGVEVNYHVTRNTKLTFDFKAEGALAELHGIGISNSLNALTRVSFAFAGTRFGDFTTEWNYDVRLNPEYVVGSGYKNVTIPIGEYIEPGVYKYLAFINFDNGTAPYNGANQGHSYFSNVKLFEATEPITNITFPTVNGSPTQPRNVQSFHGPDATSWDGLGTTASLNNEATLKITGSARRAVALNYRVTADTILEFDYEANGSQPNSLGQFQGFGIGNSLKAYLAKGFFLSGTSAASYPPEWTRDFDGYAAGSGKKHYMIPLGKYLAPGDYEYLVFVNSVNASTDSISFSNIRIYDPVGVSTNTLAYDDSGRILSTTDALGRSVTNKYDANGRLVRQTFADGTFAEHEYDAAGNCIAITDELDRTTRYVYDDRNRLIQTIYADGTSKRTRYDGAGRVVESTDELERSTQFRYDPAGRLIETAQTLEYENFLPVSVVTSNWYDYLGNLVRTTDPEGNAIVFDHDRLGRVVETRVLDDVKLYERPISLTTTQYDANGHVASQTQFDVSKLEMPTTQIPSSHLANPVNFNSLTPYSFHGPNPTATNDPSYPDGLMIVDGGRAISLDKNTRRGFDLDYNITADTVLEFDFEAPANGDLFGIGIGNALNASPAIAFRLAGTNVNPQPAPPWNNDHGNEYTVGNPKHHFTINIGAELLPGDLGLYNYLFFINSDNDSAGKSKFSNVRLYDNVGAETTLSQLAQSQSAHVQIVKNSYDAFGRPVEVTNADGKKTRTIYDSAGRVRYTFDELGRKTELVYDRFGRLERTKAPDPDGAHGPAASPYTRYVRDAAGNVTQQWNLFETNGGINPLEFVDRFEYDARNRLVTTYRKDNIRLDSVFDAAGQLVGTVDALRNSTHTTYDDRGRIVEERLADPDGSDSQFAPVTTHEYDGAGNRTATTDPLGNTTWFEYDSLNRLRQESRLFTQIVDNVDTTLGPGASFSTEGNEYYEANHPTNGPYYFESDVTYWLGWSQPNVPKATWKFEGVDAGDYRVLMTWRAGPTFDSNAQVEILVNGIPSGPAITIDQSKPGTISSSPHTPFIQWTLLDDSVIVPANIPNGSKLEVRLTGTGGDQHLLADAVRIDCIATRNYDYDRNGNLVKETDTRGNATSHIYDELNRLRQTISADPDGPGGSLRSLITDRMYDGYGNVVTEIHGYLDPPLAPPNPQTYSSVRTDKFEYDKRNRLVKEIIDGGPAGIENVTTTYKYDAVGNTTKVTDALENEAFRRYDHLDRLIDEYQDFGEGRDTATLITFDPAMIYKPEPGYYNGSAAVAVGGSELTLTGRFWGYAPISSYVANYRTVLEFDLMIEKPADYVVVGFDTNTTYDDPADNARHFEVGGRKSFNGYYNTEFRQAARPGEPIRVHIPIGQYLTDTEPLGLAISRLTFFIDTVTAPADSTDISRITFSNVRLYDSDEIRTVTTYDARGNIASQSEASDPRDITTRYQYDRLGRQTHEILDAAGLLERTYATIYDAAGNVRVERNPSGTAGSPSSVDTVHEYDRLNRLTRTALPDPDGPESPLPSPQTLFNYDAAGNLIAQTNGENEITRTTYDAQGRPIIEWDGNGDETRYQYDSEGNLTRVVDAEGNVTTYTYDGLGRQTKETITALVSGTPTQLFRTNTYNNAGNLESITDRNGRVRKFTYDTLDRLQFETWVLEGMDVDVLEWRYDKLGRTIYQRNGKSLPPSTPTAVQNAAIALGVSQPMIDTFQYDGLGRLTQQANYDPQNLADGAGSGAPRVRQTYEYAFEFVSNPFVEEFFERTNRHQYLYNAGGDIPVALTRYENDRLEQHAVVWDFDTDPVAQSPSVRTKGVVFSYDTAGNLSMLDRKFVAENGSHLVTSSAFAYDQANRLKSITHDLTTDIVHTYGHDNASRVTSFNTTGSGPATRGYTYDDAGQLKTKTGGTPESYDYDDNGNRTNAGGPNFQIGPANRLLDDGTYTYAYDGSGTLSVRTLKSNPAIHTNYVWDHRQRLTRILEWDDSQPAVTAQIYYTYDADGQLVKRTLYGTPPQHEYYVYAGDELSMSFGATGSASAVLEHRYLHGPADMALVDEVFNAAGQSTEVLWQLTDQQGTIRDIVNDTGVLRKHIDYDSFGRVTGEQTYNGAAIEQLFGYTGQQRDSVTGLQLHGERWYDPRIGRWLSEDPIGFDAGDANLYRYVGNGVTYRTDPTGTTQAGNPLNNLFGNGLSGGYVGGPVHGPKHTSQFLTSANVPAPTNSLLGLPSFQTKSYGEGSTGLGTFGSAIGNSIYTAAANYAGGTTRTALGAGLGVASALPTIAQQSATVRDDGYVRQIVPGVPIVPTRPENLPLTIQQARSRSNSYPLPIVSHQGHGYFVPDPSGAVRFVNDPSVLPLATLQRQAGREGRAAGERATALTLAQEALITFSPLHEAARDAGIAAFGYDYAEPNRSISFGERQTAAFLLSVPGGNSGQIRRGDELLDALDEYRQYGIRDRGSRLGQQQGREFRTEQLEILEFDPNAPSHVRGWLADQRRRIEQGRRVEPLTPPGYELSHGRTAPAREGYDYTNSRLQGIDLNQLEESIRRRQGKP